LTITDDVYHRLNRSNFTHIDPVSYVESVAHLSSK